MPISKANQRAVNKYVKNNYDRINVTMPKGKRELLKAHAETQGESVNGFINRAIDEVMERVTATELLRDRMREWYPTATPEDRRLCDKVYEFEDLFSDMLFKPGNASGDLDKVQVQDGDAWFDTRWTLPDVLEYFSYGSFIFRVEKLEGAAGRFTPKEYKLSVDPEYLEIDSVVLHEMIHLHEAALDEAPKYYHDVLLWCLYKDLMEKISDLDDRIAGHGHLLNEYDIAAMGGVHDVLFLLKSFDLDLRKGYPLGTVFGYGMAEEKPMCDLEGGVNNE